MQVYEEWKALTRSAIDTSPDGTRRPYWLKRPLKPVKAAYKLPERPFGRTKNKPSLPNLYMALTGTLHQSSTLVRIQLG
jgi:hypothetical protein